MGAQWAKRHHWGKTVYITSMGWSTSKEKLKCWAFLPFTSKFKKFENVQAKWRELVIESEEKEWPFACGNEIILRYHMWKLYNYLLFAILRHSSTFEDKAFFGSGPHYHGNTHHKQGGDLFICQIVVGVEDKRRSEARCVQWNCSLTPAGAAK